MNDYFKLRGLGIDIIQKYHLSEKDKYVQIPYYSSSGKFIFYKCRSKYSKKFWYYPKGSSLALYNFWNLKKYTDYVVITEGEIDCLTLLQFGINAVGSPGAGLFKESWAKFFSDIEKVYIAFDNDMAGIDGAKKLSEEIFGHRETYNILIPRDSGSKDINDLLAKLKYSRDDFMRLMDGAICYGHEEDGSKKGIYKKESKKEELKTTRIETRDIIGELYYNQETGNGGFIIFNRSTGNIEKRDRFEEANKIYIPDIDSSLISDGIIRIPGGTSDYGDIRDLLSDMHIYLNKYVDIEDEIDREIVLTYVLLTWVYRRFSSIPYLRVIGDWGSGKSRLLKVLGICYKSIYTSGNASEAPIFRLMHKYGGTLIIDEAELSRANDRCEGIKEILRFGKDSGGVVARCDGVNFEVKTYRVFGPKILGSRRSYNDDALESRIINIRMKETKAGHIPINLNLREFEADCQDIRQKLLKWSLENYFNIDTGIYSNYIDNNISKRLNEMNSPLICLRYWDKDFIEGLLLKARDRHQSLMEDKSLSLEANIVKIISEMNEKGPGSLLLKGVAEILSEEGNKNYSSRFIGTIVRDSLGLATDHTREGNIVVASKEKLDKLVGEYKLKIREDVKM